MHFKRVFISVVLNLILSMLLVYIGVNDIKATSRKFTPIIEKPSVSLQQAQKWARKKGATKTFINLAPIYWKLAPKCGVDPAVAYAQSAKETNYGKFTGVLNAAFHNPCGLKNTRGGSDYNRNAHKRFLDWATGVQAHIDHLALYAGANGYPKMRTPDPRHFQCIFKKAKYVEALGGRWAPAKNYGISLVYDFLNVMKKER